MNEMLIVVTQVTTIAKCVGTHCCQRLVRFVSGFAPVLQLLGFQNENLACKEAFYKDKVAQPPDCHFFLNLGKAFSH